jgi:phytoene synthase
MARALHQSGDGLAAAYRHCWQIASAHYENFTLGSWLLPRALRRHIAAIYAFARRADDIADEGDLEPALRLTQLQRWEQQLEDCYQGRAQDPIFIALRDTVQRFDIPIDPFRRLLHAFRADSEFQPFPTFAALRDYCRCSADPVGHLILYLFGYRDAQRQQLADQICTGLQLANFWQDVAVDAATGRVYVPEEDLVRFGCTAAELTRGQQTPALRRLMAFEVERARNLLTEGLALTTVVEQRLAREVWLFASGGLEILRAIEAVDYDVVARRPTVSQWTTMRLVLRAVVRTSLDTAPEKTGPTRDARTSPFKWIIQPFALSRRPVLAAYRRALPRSSRQTQTGVTAGVRAAYTYCQNITRRSSSNFYYAFRLLSPERRDALFAVYAFCRFVDDIADDDHRGPAGLLARWRDELGRVYDGTPTHPIGCALADAVRRFPLARQHFLDLIRGVEMDLTQRRYTTFDALYEYCYLVAATVGLLCIEIFGHHQPSARDYAVDLGIAFQLTNILRDVMEDGRRGRIYLPLEDLRRFDCTEAELLSSHYSPRLGALMAFECGRARAYYLRARGALAPEDRYSLAAAEAMRLIYERLLDRIEARHFDVFGPKVTLPRYQKLTLALAAWGRSQLAVLTS